MKYFIVDTFGNFVYLSGITEDNTTIGRWWIVDRSRFADLKVHMYLVDKHVYLRIEE